MPYCRLVSSVDDLDEMFLMRFMKGAASWVRGTIMLEGSRAMVAMNHVQCFVQSEYRCICEARFQIYNRGRGHTDYDTKI